MDNYDLTVIINITFIVTKINGFDRQTDRQTLDYVYSFDVREPLFFQTVSVISLLISSIDHK